MVKCFREEVDMGNYQQLLLEREEMIQLLHRFEFGHSENTLDRIARLKAYRDNLRKLADLCDKIYMLDDEEYQIDGDIFRYQHESPALQRKSEVKKFLEDKGINLAHYWNYAKLSPDGSYYWINPLASAVNVDWSIVLNDPKGRKITTLLIPAGTLTVGEARHGFIRRSDKKHYLDLRILVDSIIDSVSNINLSKYIISIVHY